MTNRPTLVRYKIVGWLALAAALSYLCRNAVGVAESSIREDLGLTLQQSGWVMGAFFWTYAILQIPSGWLSVRLGTKTALILFAISWSIATLGIGLAPGFWVLIIAQLVMGVAQAGIFPASTNSIGYWMPISERSSACGVLTAGMQVGAIAAGGLAGALMIPLGWRSVFIVLAIPGILWAILFSLRFRNLPEQTPAVNPEELSLIQAGRGMGNNSSANAKPLHSPNWSDLARNSAVWFLCSQQIFRAAGYMFFASWFPTFMQQTRGVSVATSGYLQGMVLAGTLTGSLVGGVVTDYIWRRTGSLRLSRCGVGSAALGCCGTLVLSAWFVEDYSVAVCLLTMGSFCAAFAGPCMFAAVIEIGGTRVPELFGLVNMAGNLSTAACPILVGMLFAWTANWNLVLVLFGSLYLLGAVCWAMVNPTGDRGKSTSVNLDSSDDGVAAPSPARA